MDKKIIMYTIFFQNRWQYLCKANIY